MNELIFDQIVSGSPVLSAAVKSVLLENSSVLAEASKRVIMEKLLAYEKNVLEGAKSFFGYPLE